MTTILETHLKTSDPDEVIECIDELCTELSGNWYFDDDQGCLMSKDKSYKVFFDPLHRVVGIYKMQ